MVVDGDGGDDLGHLVDVRIGGGGGEDEEEEGLDARHDGGGDEEASGAAAEEDEEGAGGGGGGGGSFDEGAWRDLVEKLEGEPGDSMPHRNVKSFLRGSGIRDASRDRLNAAYSDGRKALGDIVDGTLSDLVGSAMSLADDAGGGGEGEGHDGEGDGGSGGSAASGDEAASPPPPPPPRGGGGGTTERGDDTEQAPPLSYVAQSSELAQSETNILELVADNHKRRKRLVESIESNKAEFDSTHQALLALVLQQKLLKNSPESGGRGATSGIGMSDGGCDAELEDLDWDEIFSTFEPSRENLELFLNARTALQTADQRFTDAVTEIEHHLRHCLEQLEIATAGAYDFVADALDAQEDDIRAHMRSNLERREEFQRNVREQALQSQSFFQQLLSSVQNYAAGGGAGSPAAAAAASAAMTSFASVVGAGGGAAGGSNDGSGNEGGRDNLRG